MSNQVILFKDGEFSLDVNVNFDENTVWLNRNQIAALFERDVKTIGKHINNALKEELDRNVAVAKFATTTKHGAIEGKIQTTLTEFFNLDMVISVGYRVKSPRGVIFRRWATGVLRDYLVKGYAINQKRIEALNKTVEIQSRIIANTLELEEKDVLDVVMAYSEALDLLDDYDHQCVPKPKGVAATYRLTFAKCRELIDNMKFSATSDVFGVEKEEGKLDAILGAVYQHVFGEDVYPSIEEKAANLLYFLIKDHPFNDGCKRIGASLFLEFLNRNNHLVIKGEKIISDSALVAITLMIAESRPEEKEVMVKLVMNFLACPEDSSGE